MKAFQKTPSKFASKNLKNGQKEGVVFRNFYEKNCINCQFKHLVTPSPLSPIFLSDPYGGSDLEYPKLGLEHNLRNLGA